MINKSSILLMLIIFSALFGSCEKQQQQSPELLIESATAAVGVCNFELDAGSLTGWTPIFNEEFDQGFSQWNIWTGGAFNNELQYYQAPNLSISNGVLTISARKEKINGVIHPWSTRQKNFSFTSGRIESKQLFSASGSAPRVRMMARIKLPSGYGMWPAFWSYGDPWPVNGEIDILEARGQEPFSYSTNYFYGTEADKNLVTNASATITSNVSLQTCWHIYELVWEQSALSFYFDGQLVDRKTGQYVPNLFGKQEKIVLNLAVGGNFFSRLITKNIVPGAMHIDWVRVYTSQ